MSIAWLASYPKSGNTWLRFLLYSVMHGPPSQSLDIANKIPDIHRPLPTDVLGDDRIIAKTHFAYSDAHPKASETERAVLIVRHPRDVLFSALNYRRINGLTSAQMSDAHYARHFIGHRGDPEFKAQGFGTWEEHIDSWSNQTHFPVHTVRYEELKSDTATHLRAVLDFLAIDAPDAAIDAAVKASSFDSMRAMEIREKHAGTKNPKSQTLFVGSPKSKNYFMNTGKTGNSLRSISPDLESAFNKAFAAPMQRFGYE
jgi:hypothetical protein